MSQRLHPRASRRLRSTRLLPLALAGSLFACDSALSPEPPVEVRVDPSSVTLEVGERAQLSASVSHASDGGVHWSSDDPSVAQVNGAGTVVAIGEGATWIRAAAQADPGSEAAVRVTVLPAPPTTGRVAFWTDNAALTPITVTLAAGSGNVTGASGAAPSCGQGGAYTATLPAGTHAYTASSPTGVTWSGTVEVEAGRCVTMRLHAAQLPAVSFTTPSTYFIDGSRSFSGLGGYWSQGFTLSRTTTLVLRVVSTYAVDAAIFTPDQLGAFQNNRSFSGWGNFDDQFGTARVTLPAGEYYVGVRNQVDGSNRFRLELDLDIELAPEKGYSFSYVDDYFGASENVDANGGLLWQPFTVQSGFRYLLDGASVGLETYVIPAEELSNFRNNRSFRYYEDYGGEDGAFPGLWEIDLPPGSYYLVFRNSGSEPGTVTYTMERWRVEP